MKPTEEMIEVAARAMCEAWYYSKIGTPDGDAEWRRKQNQYRMQARAALTAALAAMPWPASRDDIAVKVQGIFAGTLDVDQDGDITGTGPASYKIADVVLSSSCLTPAPDIASENERLRAALHAKAEKVGPLTIGEIDDVFAALERKP